MACTDQDNRFPARHASRGGMGAVMGAKGLKFVAVEPGRAKLRRAAKHAECDDKRLFLSMSGLLPPPIGTWPQKLPEGLFAPISITDLRWST